MPSNRPNSRSSSSSRASARSSSVTFGRSAQPICRARYSGRLTIRIAVYPSEQVRELVDDRPHNLEQNSEVTARQERCQYEDEKDHRAPPLQLQEALRQVP